MDKRVFIIHGWDGAPDHGWQPWLKRELEKKGFRVFVPAMPNSPEPEMKAWLTHLKKQVGKPDKDTYLVGHSMGCQAILRYLDDLPESSRIGGAVLVAGFVNLKNITEEEKPIAKPWLETPINWQKIKLHTNNFVAIFSDNDKWVPLSDSKIFKEKLEAKIIIFKNKGHISEDDGVTELPSALEAILSIEK